MFFEAAVRHLSFTGTAQELGTSQPAVSQRISSRRRIWHGAVQPGAPRGFPVPGRDVTGHGYAVEPDQHHEAAAKIRNRHKRQVLTVATDFGFATYWLMPRLATLRDLVPELDVRIVTTQNQFDIRGEPVDMAIALGDGEWPGCSSHHLFSEIVLPVCSPAFQQRHALGGQPARLCSLPLLHLESAEPQQWMLWEGWFSAHGLRSTGGGHDLTLNNYPLVIQAAVAGQCVALGWAHQVDVLVRHGQLVPAVKEPLRTERGYFLLEPKTRRNNETLHGFRTWIVQECAVALNGSPFKLVV